MIPEPLEYLALIAIYAVLIVSIFLPQVVESLRSRAFWISTMIFAGLWAAFDCLGIRLGMWSFSAARTVGLKIFEIPVEEFLVFFLIQLNTVAAWQAFRLHPAAEGPR